MDSEIYTSKRSLKDNFWESKGNKEQSKNFKVNSMINNFWSYKYIVQRLREKAEEYGIEIVKVNEYKTSICPRYGSDIVIKREDYSNA